MSQLREHSQVLFGFGYNSPLSVSRYIGDKQSDACMCTVQCTWKYLSELAPVPQKASRLVAPVATEFDLLTVNAPGVLNLFINDDDVRRTIYVLEDQTESFKFDFYSRKQNSDFDLRLGWTSCCTIKPFWLMTQFLQIKPINFYLRIKLLISNYQCLHCLKK